MNHSPFPVTINLDIAADNFRVPTPGMKFLFCDLASTGYGTMRVGSTSAESFSITPGAEYAVAGENVFLTWLSQPGKTLRLFHSERTISPSPGNRIAIDPKFPTGISTGTNFGLGLSGENFFTETQNQKGCVVRQAHLNIAGGIGSPPPAGDGAVLIAANTAAGSQVQMIMLHSTWQPYYYSIENIYIPPAYSLKTASVRNAAGSEYSWNVSWDFLS